MVEIQLTQGKVALVDDEDFERLSQFKWCAYTGGCNYYAMTNIRKKDGKRTSLQMHRFIMSVFDSKTIIDHINGNGLDNRKDNLRICTQAENTRNRSKSLNNTSGFKGVYWHKYDKKWHAQIIINYKKIHLGIFTCKIEAAQAYNQAAIKYHGEFAQLNQIEG